MTQLGRRNDAHRRATCEFEEIRLHRTRCLDQRAIDQRSHLRCDDVREENAGKLIGEGKEMEEETRESGNTERLVGNLPLCSLLSAR